MAKFVIVKKAPDKLKSGEIVIKAPDFLEEIELSRNRAKIGGKLVTTMFLLKDIAGNIGRLYDPEEFNPIAGIPYNRYVGVPYEDVNDLSKKIVIKMFEAHYPKMFYKYLDTKIKGRPTGTKTIYYLGTAENTQVFLDNGIDQSTPKELKKQDKKDQKDEKITT